MKFELAFDFTDFNRRLIIEHKRLINEVFEKNMDKFIDGVKAKFASKIRTSGEYRSLVSPAGRLRLDFGLGEEGGAAEGILDPKEAMREIIELVISGVTVKIVEKRIDENFVIGLNIKLLENMDAIINSDAGKYFSINTRGDINEVPWLEWILTGGASSVLVGYQVLYKESDASRTDRAIMVKGGSFGVDSRYTGTKNNNFITRAAEDMNSNISDLIDKHFLAKFK